MNNRSNSLKGYDIHVKMKELQGKISVLEKMSRFRGIACSSLIPLSVALYEASCFFMRIADGYKLEGLFDGGQLEGPNIDTTMKCIRDLCSASLFALGLRYESAPEIISYEIVTPGEKVWLDAISVYVNRTNHEDLQQVAHLLDDVLESVLSISLHLDGIEGDKADIHWSGISRHVRHIIDHFDYAEDSLIGIIADAT